MPRLLAGHFVVPYCFVLAVAPRFSWACGVLLFSAWFTDHNVSLVLLVGDGAASASPL